MKSPISDAFLIGKRQKNKRIIFSTKFILPTNHTNQHETYPTGLNGDLIGRTNLHEFGASERETRNLLFNH